MAPLNAETWSLAERLGPDIKAAFWSRTTQIFHPSQGDGLETLAFGATLGLVLSPSIAMRLSYRELVYSNVPDSSGGTLEVTAAFLF